LILQDFNLSLWVRPLLASSLWIVMAGLFIAGYGLEWWVDLIDVIVGGFIAYMHFNLDRGRARYIAEFGEDFASSIEDRRPLPAASVRVFWLIAYVTLAVILGVTMTVQTAYLPHPTTEN
jgi:hypothetical protein